MSKSRKKWIAINVIIVMLSDCHTRFLKRPTVVGIETDTPTYSSQLTDSSGWIKRMKKELILCICNIIVLSSEISARLWAQFAGALLCLRYLLSWRVAARRSRCKTTHALWKPACLSPRHLRYWNSCGGGGRGAGGCDKGGRECGPSRYGALQSSLHGSGKGQCSPS